MSSPLDRIEAAFSTRTTIGTEDGPELVNVVWREDVLALVNVAKAAEQYVAAEQADEDALGELLGRIVDDSHDERLRDAAKEANRAAGKAYDALREALAVLNKEQPA